MLEKTSKNSAGHSDLENSVFHGLVDPFGLKRSVVSGLVFSVVNFCALKAIGFSTTTAAIAVVPISGVAVISAFGLTFLGITSVIHVLLAQVKNQEGKKNVKLIFQRLE